MGGQHMIIYHMVKHEKQQNCAKATPLFTIPNSITKDLTEIIQVWIQNESACPLAMRQLPDRSLNLHNVDLYV